MKTLNLIFNPIIISWVHNDFCSSIRQWANSSHLIYLKIALNFNFRPLALSMPNALSSFLKTRWPLLLVLLIFICFKIPQLHYPFYIDEGMVYGLAVKMMTQQGPSLMPGSIPPDFSRGHPLMFHFLCGLWIKCLGSSNTAIHSFSWLFLWSFLSYYLRAACSFLTGRLPYLSYCLFRQGWSFSCNPLLCTRR